MAALVWVMVGIALWHFTIFLPDHFWAGIVGAFVGAVVGAFLFGLLINVGSVPGQSDTTLLTGLEAVPGAIAGIAAVYVLGIRNERAEDRPEERADDPAPEAVGQEDREVPEGEAHHDPGEHAHQRLLP